jgi:dUTP pyrophosphatase
MRENKIIIKVLQNEVFDSDQKLPTTGTDKSTGYDLIATSEPKIIGDKIVNKNASGEEIITYKNIQYIEYKTELKYEILSYSYYDALLMPRSSIRKYNLILANSIGLIDYDYRGEILVCFKYVWQPEDFKIVNGQIEGNVNFDKIYKKGDKICQLKFTKVERANFQYSTSLEKTNRGDGGFGSTDTNTPNLPDSSLADMIKNYKNNPVYTPEILYLL